MEAVSFYQNEKLNEQTEILYQHPLLLRRSLDVLNNNIYSIQIAQRDLILAKTEKEKQENIQKITLAGAEAQKQLKIIEDKYLGDNSDVEEVNKSFILWEEANNEVNSKILSGEIKSLSEIISSEGTLSQLSEKMFTSIEKIDGLSKNKADEVYKSSIDLKNKLNIQQTGLFSLIFLISIIIAYTIIQNIQKPLDEMNNTVLSFQNGNMDARSSYKFKNEFGVLSKSINTMLGLVQENTTLSSKAANLSEVILSEEDTKEFFQATLLALIEHTGSQMAAVYLMNEERKVLEYFESIGLDDTAKISFSTEYLEGLFGAAILSRKLQHIKDVPENSRFIFNTVNGRFIPREIITIPIISGTQIIAVISIGTISNFAPRSIDFINSILITLSTRIEGVLAYNRIKFLKEELEQHNRELIAQKSKLTTQSAELTQQNAELEMQKKQLDEASRLKTNFLSNMSHELRTPLNSVIALSGVLSRRLMNKIPEEEYGYLEIIERNGKNLLNLINDVLDISRIEAGREEIEITKFNVNNMIEEIAALLEPQAAHKELNIVQESRDSNLFISSDIDKCRHILQNLIGNAIKFTESGRILISTEMSENGIQIKVKDTGIGIPKEHLPYIFDEFRQADGSTSRRYGGTGLGLAIAKKYANLLGGTISVESEPGEGSEFTVILPQNYSAENKIEEKADEAEIKYPINKSIVEPVNKKINPDSDNMDKTILLVDDNESAIIQIKDLVEEMGHKVLIAKDALEAFEIIEDIIPDAMVLDLMMPDIDGFRLLESIRNAEPTAHVPVLVLTAKHITKEELKELKRNHIHQLIQKGDVNRKDLQNAVNSMLFPEAVEIKSENRDKKAIKDKPLVLVVEDNPDNMITVKALLSDNYKVIEGVNGKEGISMAISYKPDLILMDIALPEINGIDAFIEIQKRPELTHIPVIALTASAMNHERETILAHGFHAFIGKPIIAKQFFDVINEVLYGK
ncbi:response regulator [Clostridium beijerinckii]|uniref:response regulator n=1 Tax=Clostridium beijerinckii TaxID=1520 RepID=UPI001A9A8F64|nr:response regulator [Clostridium beijerinckii]NRT72262.1 signal transduction histidine kinase/CheY-like chemotaxis protein/HAMP domain-containing protein [Clostridium beijerinckii]